MRHRLQALASILTCLGLVAISACTADDSSGVSGSRTAVSTSAVPSSPSANGSTSEAPGPQPASGTVDPPTPGNINETVPPVAVETKPAVPLDKPANFGGGVMARIIVIKAIKAVAKMPGEVAGPALELTVRIDNKSNQVLNLNDVVVNVLDDTGSPGGFISSGSQPLTGTVKAGAQMDGKYVFTVPVDRRAPVTVDLTLTAGRPVVIFKGTP